MTAVVAPDVRARISTASWSFWLGVDTGVQAAGRCWLMSPAQVVRRWIGWPGLIGATSLVSLGARWQVPWWGR